MTENKPATTSQPAGQPEMDQFVLRLYVSGATQRSLAAIENIRNICETNLKGRCDLQIIDIYQQPGLARSAQIVAAPTLIKHLPPPLRHLVGDLSERDKVLIGLELIPRPRAG